MVFRSAIFIAIFFPACVFGQTNRYVVFFKDKTNTPFTVDQPTLFLSSKAIARRDKQQIAVTQEDLPVNPAYVTEVKNTGARTFFSSRWMNCILVEVGADSVTTLESLPMVTKVEMVAPGKQLSGGRKKKFGDIHLTQGAGATAEQLEQLGIDEMHNLGFDGKNISIAVLDGGFPGVDTAVPFSHLFANGQIKQTCDFVGNTGNVYQYNEHGTEVLSIIGAKIQDNYAGGAPESDFFLYVTEDSPSEYLIEEYNWLFAAEKADSAGVDIISSSLGYNEFDDPSMDYTAGDLDGKTAVVTRAASFALLRGMIVVCSAGNEGAVAWHFVTPPADAVGILAVGAVDGNGIRAPFSSVGPTADARIKPDVVALGVGNTVIHPSGEIASGNGTSFACPLIASLASGVWQAYPDLTAAKLYAAIIQSGDQANAPDNQRGYGLPNFMGIKNIIETTDINDQVTIHPNPAGPSVTVTIRKPTNEPCTITIYDCLGRALSVSNTTLSWQDNPFQLSLYGMSPGVYFIQFRSQSISRTLKLVKA